MQPLTRIKSQNAELESSIKALAAGQHAQEAQSMMEGSEDTLQSLVLAHYSNIVELANLNAPRASQKALHETWNALLATSTSFEALKPHGTFLAARMLLYFATGLQTERNLLRVFGSSAAHRSLAASRSDLLLALDEALLACLRTLWRQKPEDFGWVMGEHRTYNTAPDPEYTANHQRWAGITNPQALRESGFVPRHRFKWCLEGDRYNERQDDSGIVWHHGPVPEAEDDNERLVVGGLGWTTPMGFYERYNYNVTSGDENEDVQVRSRPIVPRSRQFVLDARTVMADESARASWHAAQMTLARLPFPLELRRMVMDYVGRPRGQRPYVCHLDLAAVYRPFPEKSEKCKGCVTTRRGPARIEALSCPEKSIVVWNLVLREFHTCHHQETSSLSPLVCREIDCQGHHSEQNWSLQGPGEIRETLEAVIRSRCGPDATLESVGLGPVENIVAASRSEDDTRCRQIFRRLDKDEENHELTLIGLGGLLDTMGNALVLINKWRQRNGRTSTSMMAGAWAYGRTNADQEKAARGFRDAIRRGDISDTSWDQQSSSRQ